MTSLPDSAIGRVIAWIGNGVEMPASASASAISLRIPKSANDWVATGASSLTVSWAEVLSSSALAASAGERSPDRSAAETGGTCVGEKCAVFDVGVVLSVEGSGYSWLPSDCSSAAHTNPDGGTSTRCGGAPS